MSTENKTPDAVDPLQFLTADERAALEMNYDDEQSEEPVNRHDVDYSKEKEQAPEPKPADPPEPAAKAEEKPAEAAPAPAPAAEAPSPEAKTEPEPAKPKEAPQAPAVAPILVMTAPEDAKEQLEAIEKDKEFLDSQFDAGEITYTELREKLKVLDKAERKIELAVNNAEMAQQLQVQQAKNLWDTQCAAFLALPEAKAYTDKPELFAEFNATVIAVSNVPRNKSLTGTQILEKAHALMKADMPDQFGVPPAQDEAKPAEKAPPKPRDALPPTIGTMPSADPTTAAGGKYDSLNRMQTTDPIGYEAAIKAMSEKERAAYMRD